MPIAYGRGGTIDDRLSVWPQLREAVCLPRSIIIDPDSRLTQLGLLPICPEEDYYLFESRSYGADGDDPLSALTERWVSETFGVVRARPYISTGLDAADFAPPSASALAKIHPSAFADRFEEELLRRLPRPILIDKGAGGEEAERVERAVAKAGGEGIVMWDGSFAGFAAHIQRSRLYVGYDSAGGHVAAACGIPMISIFAGAVSERMFQRWRPTGRRQDRNHSSRPNAQRPNCWLLLRLVFAGFLFSLIFGKRIGRLELDAWIRFRTCDTAGTRCRSLSSGGPAWK